MKIIKYLRGVKFRCKIRKQIVWLWLLKTKPPWALKRKEPLTATAQRISALLFIVLYKKHEPSPDKPRANLTNLTQTCAFIIMSAVLEWLFGVVRTGGSSINWCFVGAECDRRGCRDLSEGRWHCTTAAIIHIHLLDDVSDVSRARSPLIVTRIYNTARRTYSASDCLC